jgi:hypothetical protein
LGVGGEEKRSEEAEQKGRAVYGTIYSERKKRKYDFACMKFIVVKSKILLSHRDRTVQMENIYHLLQRIPIPLQSCNFFLFYP